jgi:hypothetical protein
VEGHEAGEKSELLKNAVIALVPSQPEIAPVSSVSSFWDYFNEMKISRESGACPEIGAKSKIISCFISVYGQFYTDGGYASHMK